ncbi:Bud-site selection protein [Pleurotus eryngii]|uniref:Bud-site selection protein n=1 Tax=Pleurotus eryngii TaxID=5323 RepID=A0A9P6A004_PLEER|nr:Bud-site selection protein [Pleurotus eryngii]
MTGQNINLGLKRKRTEPAEGIQADLERKFAGKLHHGIKEGRKAARKAKTFETQKLIKKLKHLRSVPGNSSTVQDAEAELEALKGLNTDTLAEVALHSKIKKDKTLCSNESIQTSLELAFSLGAWSASFSGTPSAKVQARILSSKYLAVESTRILEALRSVVNPGERPKRVGQDQEESVDLDTSTPITEGRHYLATDAGHEAEAEDTHSETAAISDDEGEDEEGWESGTVGGDEEDSGEDFERRSRPTPGNDMANSDSDSDSDGASQDMLHNQPTKKARLAGKEVTSVNSASTFLPSLSVGYIRGDSGDSDVDGSDAGKPDIQPRKNRRGQRARRAIWEKKYGRNANHKKKEIETSSRHTRPPTPQTSGRGRKMGNKVIPDGSANKVHALKSRTWGEKPSHDQKLAVSKSATRQLPASQTEGSSLHPSWEAKRKAKERIGIVPSQGKKIVFS